MQRNYYSDRFLDEDFEEVVRSKEKQVLEKYNEQALKDLYFDNAQKINRALIGNDTNNNYYKDISRRNKRWMLEYLDKCIIEDLSNLSYREKIELKGAYLSKIDSNLVHLDFKVKDYIPFFIVAGLAIDILLTILGIAKYYYYIPIIFIVVTYAQLKGLYRAKKAGKLLR